MILRTLFACPKCKLGASRFLETTRLKTPLRFELRTPLYRMWKFNYFSMRLPSWDEPDYSQEDRQNETPIDWKVTVTAFGLQPNKFYIFQRYNDTAFLPNGTRKGSPDKLLLVKPEKEEHAIVDKISTKSATHYRCILQRNE